MNNQTYKILFELLSLQEKKELYEIPHFKTLINEAKKQTVDGILYTIPQLKVEEEEKGAFLQWISAMPKIEMCNQWMNKQVANLAQLLDKKQIRYVVMKGQTCAYYYPNPLLRRSGDIDVYIAQNDYNRANEIIKAQGFKKIDETMLHSTYQKGELVIEVHFAIQKLQWSRTYHKLQNITQREVDHNPNMKTLEIGGYPVAVLPSELNMVLLTVHPFNHIVSGGLGLRQVMDWMLVFEQTKESMDLTKLKVYLDQLHLTRMFRTLAYLCVTYLGMKEEIARLDKQQPAFFDKDVKMGERLLSWIIEAGNFGQHMELGKGKERFVRYYALFLYNCMRFFWLNPTEMLAWPWMKLYRGITGKNHLHE